VASLAIFALAAIGVVIPAAPALALTDEIAVPCDTGLLVTYLEGLGSSGGTDIFDLAAGCNYAFTSPFIDPSDSTNTGDALPPFNNLNTTIAIINGDGATISRGAGASDFRFFETNAGTNVTINNLTLSGGRTPAGSGGSSPTASPNGGAILNDGNLTLNGVTLTNNQTGTAGSGSSSGSTNGVPGASSGQGGAIWSDGGLTINDSTVTSNTTGQGGNGGGALGNGGPGGESGEGGAIASINSLSVSDSTFSSNTTGNGGSGGSAIDSGPAGAHGGGAAIVATGSVQVSGSLFHNNVVTGNHAWGGAINVSSTNLTVVNSTFVGNQAERGAALFATNGSHSTLTESTFNGNSASSSGDVIAMDNGSVTSLGNTIMAGNGGTADCGANQSGSATSYNNLGGEWGDETGVCAGTIVVSGLSLGALANNGGPTQTEALAAGNALINAGAPAECSTTDERGVPRPQGFGCDIGAYEYVSPPPSGSISGTTNTLTGTTHTYTSSVSDASLYYNWSVTGVTSTITGNGSNSPQIKFTSVGTAIVTLSVGVQDATDGQATESLTVNVGPTGDPGPTVTMTTTSGTVNEGSTFTFSFTAAHASGYSFGYATGYPDCGAGASVQSQSITSTGGSFTCFYPLGGSLTAHVQLVDIYGVTSSIATAPVTVNVVAPTIVISGNASPNEGATSTYSYTLTTPGSDALTATTTCTGGATKVAGSDTFTGTLNVFSGTFQCKTPNGPSTEGAKVSSGSASSTYALSVQNLPPSIHITGPTEVNENGNTPSTYVYTLGGTDPSATDQANLALVAGTASCGAAGIGSVVSATATAITCRFNGPGTAVVAAVVVDPDGADSTGGSEGVQVDNVAPVITFNEPSGSISEGTPSTYAFSATDAGLDTLVVTVPSGCTATTPYTSAPGSVSGNITCQNLDGPASIDHVLGISDGTTTSTATITQHILDVAPTISASLSDSIGQGGPITMFVGNVVDPGQDTVTEWIVHWGDGTTDTFTSAPGAITHVFSADGYNDPTIDVVDEDGIHLNVASPMEILIYNAAPTIVFDDLPTDVNEGTTSTIHYTITDPDVGDTETVHDITCGTSFENSIIINPVSNIVQSGRTGSFDCTWVDGDSNVTVTAFVNDDVGNPGEAQGSVTIHNLPPTITWDPTDSLTAVVSATQTYTYHYSATDPGVDDVLLGLGFYPGGNTRAYGCGDGSTVIDIEFDSSTRKGFITCQFSEPGIAHPMVTVYDGSSWPTVTESVTVADIAPTVSFTDVEPTEINEGDTVEYTFQTVQPSTSGWAMVGSPGCGAGGSLVSSSIDPGSSTNSFVCRYGDGPATSAASVTIANAVDPTLTASATSDPVTIDNIAPTTSISGSSEYFPATPYDLTLGPITDPGQDTVSAWTVHWGDGTSDTYGSATPDPTHTYATASTHTISLDITDEDGTFPDVAELTVKTPDNTPPVIHMTGPYAVEATGPDGAPVFWVLPIATDDRDGTDGVTCGSGDDFPGQTYPLGLTQLNCLSEDSSGNFDENEYLQITVVDTTAPAITPPADVTAEATSADGALVSYSGESATDLVDGDVGVGCLPASGSAFAIGTTTVTCSASDGRLNTGHATFDVTVQDTTGPVLVVPADFTVGATSAAGADVTYAATATDAVDGSIAPSCSPASGSLFPRETSTTVTCSATDSSSNSSSASFTVSVHGTVLSADAAAGDRKVEVDDSTGFAAGDYAVIDPGAVDQEVRYIHGIGSLDFAAPLASAHPTGTLVATIAPPGDDTAAPTIAVAAPATSERIKKGAVVIVTFSCSDGGVGVEGCVGTTGSGFALPTGTVGTHTFSVESWDFNGNDTVTTISYVVVAQAVVLGATGDVLPYGIAALALLLLAGGTVALWLTRRRRAHQA
jgi:HYR domain